MLGKGVSGEGRGAPSPSTFWNSCSASRAWCCFAMCSRCIRSDDVRRGNAVRGFCRSLRQARLLVVVAAS
jgi:hypothetical protein